jgi:hypothetical protein
MIMKTGKLIRSSYSWLMAIALFAAYVVVPGCMTDPATTSVNEDELGKAPEVCPPCQQVLEMQARGEPVAPQCAACPAPGCGDGICGTGENSSNCPIDCGGGGGGGPTGPVCGNRICESGEVTTCPSDCTSCGPLPLSGGGTTNKPICPA